MTWRRLLASMMLGAFLVASAHSGAAGQGTKLTLRIGSKNFTEQFILAEM